LGNTTEALLSSEDQTNTTNDAAERLRYLNYLQGTLIREGTEQFLANQRKWFEDNRARLAREYELVMEASGRTPSALDNPYLTHHDRSAHDSVFARHIFTPILERALAVTAKLGLSIKRPVVLANAPSVELTPVSWASTDTHMLFVGQGTSSFCNYWSKVYAAVIYCIATLPEAERTPEGRIHAVGTNPITLTAVKLLFRYLRSESLMGFGEVKQGPHLMSYREMLCHSMETFIVGHELGHFCLHEAHPETNGVPPGKTLKEVELLCDAMGFSISSAVGAAMGDDVSKHLIGPLLLLYTLRLNEQADELILERPAPESETHPSLKERIGGLFAFAATAAPAGDLTIPLKEAMSYANVLGSILKETLRQAKSGDASEGSGSKVDSPRG
jgi:hypothetical protein